MDGSSFAAHSPSLEALSTPELASRITELAGHLNAANRRFLSLIAEFDRRQGWSDSLTHSCAHWLNWQCGIDIGGAREKVRVAHALEKLPLISAAMARGGTQLFESPRDHARGLRGHGARVPADRPARHGPSRRDRGATVPSGHGGGGVVA